MKASYAVRLLLDHGSLPERGAILERFRRAVLGDAYRPLPDPATGEGLCLAGDRQAGADGERPRIVLCRSSCPPERGDAAWEEGAEMLPFSSGDREPALEEPGAGAGAAGDGIDAAVHAPAGGEPRAETGEADERARIVIDRRSYHPDRDEVARVERTETVLVPKDARRRLQELGVLDPEPDEGE